MENGPITYSKSNFVDFFGYLKNQQSSDFEHCRTTLDPTVVVGMSPKYCISSLNKIHWSGGVHAIQSSGHARTVFIFLLFQNVKLFRPKKIASFGGGFSPKK